MPVAHGLAAYIRFMSRQAAIIVCRKLITQAIKRLAARPRSLRPKSVPTVRFGQSTDKVKAAWRPTPFCRESRQAAAIGPLSVPPERAGQTRFRPAKRRACPARFVGPALVQIRSDDHFVHQPIRAWRQTISDTRVYVETPDLEIDHRIDVVLLLVEGQPPLQRSKIGIILDPDCQILAKIAREARGRHELRPAILSKPEVDDRVDDELVIALAPTDDWPDLHVPAGLGELRHSVAELEIDAVEELPLGCVWNDEQLSDLGGIGIGRQLLINRIRRVEAHLPPVRDAIGPFAGALKRVIGNKPAGEIGLLAAHEGVVVMQLKRPLSDLRDLSVVDLNLVVRSRGYGRRREQDRRKCKTPWRDHAGISRPATRASTFCSRKMRPWLRQSHTDLELL